MRNVILRLTAAAFFFGLIVQPHAFAVSKDMIQLQTQVQQLQDALQHLQTSNDERMGVLVNLVQQNTDSVNKMTALINSLSGELKTENDASGSRNTQLSTQVQGLNDSVDELKTRIANLATQLQGMQGQMQNVNTTTTTPGAVPQAGNAMPQSMPAAGPPSPEGGQAALAPPASQAPPLDQLYEGALRDYNSAKYPVSTSEFTDVIRYYPQDPLAGNAQFYLGEIAYRQGKYQDAVKSYDAVLEKYSGNTKAPAAELRKGESLLKLGEKDAGVRELRTLVQRYPQTPEAQEGRSTLSGLGVRVTAEKPSAYPR